MNQNIKLFAFLIEGPAGGVPGFQQSIVLPASQSELEEKIRKETHCPDAEVKIVNPSEWGPPALAAISDQAISNKAQIILDRIITYLIDHAIQIDRGDLEKGGTEIRNPVSGKVFFVFRSSFDPLYIVPGDTVSESEAKSSPLENLNSESAEQFIAAIRDAKVSTDFAFKDDVPQEAAVKGLAQLGALAVEPLIAAMKGGKLEGNVVSPVIYTYYVKALSKIGDPRAVKTLMALRDDVDFNMSLPNIFADLVTPRYKYLRQTIENALTACSENKQEKLTASIPTQNAVAQQPVRPQPAQPIPPLAGQPVAKQTNGLATISMVLGIASIPFSLCYGAGVLLGIAAFIMGLIARKQIQARAQEGSGKALTGIITGGITAVGVLVIVILALLGPAIATVFSGITSSLPTP